MSPASPAHRCPLCGFALALGDALCGACGAWINPRLYSATRVDAEQAIWQAMTRHEVTVTDAVMFLDAILNIMDAYAAGDDEKLTAMRREVLAREGRPL